jgi:hypothetical protein
MMDNQLTLFRQSPGRIHAGRVDSSPRLQRVLAVLADGERHTTRDLMFEANVCAVNSCVAEIRANGIDVRCEAVARGRYVYWIEQEETR